MPIRPLDTWTPGLKIFSPYHLSSIGTMLGIGSAIVLGDKWIILDPIASIIVSLFIFKVSYDILIPSLNELAEKSLSQEKRKKVEGILKETHSVLDYHKLRMRRVGNKVVIEAHILVDDHLNIKDAHDIAVEVENRIKSSFSSDSIITIHIEPYIQIKGPKPYEKRG